MIGFPTGKRHDGSSFIFGRQNLIAKVNGAWQSLYLTYLILLLSFFYERKE